MNLEILIPLIVALISLVGNIIQYKSSKIMAKENQNLKNKIIQIKQTHSGNGDIYNAGGGIWPKK
jgi:hypothetical protein